MAKIILGACDNVALLGCYAAQTFRGYLLVPILKVRFDTWNMGITGCLETSESGNIPEELRSHLHRAGNLETRIPLGYFNQITQRH